MGKSLLMTLTCVLIQYFLLDKGTLGLEPQGLITNNNSNFVSKPIFLQRILIIQKEKKAQFSFEI